MHFKSAYTTQSIPFVTVLNLDEARSVSGKSKHVIWSGF